MTFVRASGEAISGTQRAFCSTLFCLGTVYKRRAYGVCDAALLYFLTIHLYTLTIS